MHTPSRPPRQGQEGPRVALFDSCRLRVRGYIFESHPFRGRESWRGNLSSCRMDRGAKTSAPRPLRQGKESPRATLSDSCRLRVWGYIFESHPFRGRESPRIALSSCRMRRGVLHTPPNLPRQERESPRGNLSDSCRLRVRGYIFESHPFRGRESRRVAFSSCRMRGGVLHTPPIPPHQERESPRVTPSDSCQLRVGGYIFESHPFRERESCRRLTSSCRQGRGVLHTPSRPPRQGRESRRVALFSC